ncbi:hypothetical protein [Alkalicoccus urumqiensis]|uniref:Resolvase HTH domain-containing protein n=1 Tax=Alkalicoccus urumqiensis TaxID=1548213 RepID=A0A2P6MFS7_ALKUR|nr:hypothetical protein [Alkalicoccus urumqiensis]PRO65144.1 hypothetical protein C6I21_11930 [Alkalicoccus urumqiensis]
METWMDFAVPVLLAVGVLLLTLSIIRRDSTAELKQELEHQSLQHMKELYQLQQRVRRLEASLTEPEPLTRDEVLELQEEGYTLSAVSEMTGISKKEIEQLLE